MLFLGGNEKLTSVSFRRYWFYHPEFLVIIPTHNHPETIEFSIQSVLMQKSQDFLLLIICDGVADATRVKLDIYRTNRRVKILDFPKSERVGEEYRDFAIRHYPSKYISYLGDDDLFFPHHLDAMRHELMNNDFTHPAPAYIDKEKNVNLFAKTNLSNPKWVEWHLSGPPYRNSISLTGVTHSRASYLALSQGWTTTPSNRWPDHFMWEKFLGASSIRCSTSPLSTTIKSPQRFFNSDERREHVSHHFKQLNNSQFFEEWNKRIVRAQSLIIDLP